MASDKYVSSVEELDQMTRFLHNIETAVESISRITLHCHEHISSNNKSNHNMAFSILGSSVQRDLCRKGNCLEKYGGMCKQSVACWMLHALSCSIDVFIHHSCSLQTGQVVTLQQGDNLGQCTWVKVLIRQDRNLDRK